MPSQGSVQTLNKLKPVPFRILSINDSEFAILVGSKFRFGDESNPAGSKFLIGLTEVFYIEADVTGAELMLVQITPGRRWIQEMNQFDLMVSFKTNKYQLSMRPGNTGVVSLRRGQRVDPAEDSQPEFPGIESNHVVQVPDYDSRMVKTLNQ